MSLAIFDLDNTLLNGDSDHAWGEFLVNKGIVDEAFYRRQNDHFYELYKQSKLDIMEYLAFALEPLTRFTLAELAALHAQFMAEYINPMRQPKADALLRRHREQGDFLLIITATNGFVTRPIAQALGVDDILATDPEVEGDRYTGRIVGTPCYQEGKVTRLNQWLQQTHHTLDNSYFYSDSINDLPLLQAVTHPVVVDGDQRLTSAAQQRGWPCISLRD
ncbi:MAG: HAD-IB family hydrolase [Pseudomonadales bacterium]|jgi:HAD superfamily hydrolase (TIGR01490 family)|uniref:histidinol-phosphatase n=1 Tax=unclassified Ketobacter TaxID=2639109 RepID=UPI000C9552CE|nr:MULTISPECIES: HAD family hydrolase [unclassified Ketobacter]MAA59060.1 HAD-IB family hydrolase [Pseudomonadales bacterium]MEC8811591.1 HAD family hydrolase [Pseudomonadota bacterium]TNC90284.1 MAG: HAD-IB family hydrolase [Alcanivorax sp.]HAG96878.1 HAD-IB family hydrolase [Gammaproteobacteria bacterium]MAQ26140.1 HAD-IB family hydrolase [Pseudomonadales bacterium]|tara:strand:- start:89 stop:745 length:657 start_codon:yes stop_codon:yes gene_type:complete